MDCPLLSLVCAGSNTGIIGKKGQMFQVFQDVSTWRAVSCLGDPCCLKSVKPVYELEILSASEPGVRGFESRYHR